MTRWIMLAVLVVGGTVALALARLPTPWLFGSLLGALAYALLRPGSGLTLPKHSMTVGQAVVGAIVGSAVVWDDLVSLGPRWLVVLAVSCFSLVVSVLVGRLLIRKGVSPVTATFSSIAGGAAGLTAVADELGADDRVVAVLQYLRLLVVLVTMPLVVLLVFDERVETATSLASQEWWVDVAYAALALTLGLAGGKVLRIPSYAILGPILAAALLRLAPWFTDATVPLVVEVVGYAAIGIQVGLKFTVASIRQIRQLVPTALLTIAVTLVACAGLGWLLTVTTDASPLDAYLATTPGGIYAVMGTSAATGGDVTFVAASQVLRLLIVLASAPFVAAYLRRTA